LLPQVFQQRSAIAGMRRLRRNRFDVGSERARHFQRPIGKARRRRQGRRGDQRTPRKGRGAGDASGKAGEAGETGAKTS
jgi:hypothetical protein